LLLRLTNLPTSQCQTILKARATEVGHVLNREEAVYVIRDPVLQDWNLQDQSSCGMRHGAEIPQHRHGSRQMLQHVQHRDGVQRAVTVKTLEVSMDKLDLPFPEHLAASLNGWFIDVHANFLDIFRQHGEETAVVTPGIKTPASGAEQSPGIQPFNLFLWAARCRPI
jgi:hypothetical protein